MVVPLLAGSAVLGAMAVWRNGGTPFEPQEREFSWSGCRARRRWRCRTRASSTRRRRPRAADRDGRGAAGHQPIGRRPAAGVRRDPRQLREALSQHAPDPAARRRRRAAPSLGRHTAATSRGAPAASTRCRSPARRSELAIAERRLCVVPPYVARRRRACHRRCVAWPSVGRRRLRHRRRADVLGRPRIGVSACCRCREGFTTRSEALLQTFADQAGDRDPERAPVPRDAGGARRGRGRERGQERVPGDDEPRDPHADERRDRHDRAAARHAARRRAARLRRRPSATRATRCWRSSTTSSTSRRSRPGRMDIERSRSTCASASSRRSTWSAPRAAEKRLESAYVVEGDVPRRSRAT